MCCFSGTVRNVAGTRIFARALSTDRQGLAYAMSFEAAMDLAMVLPIPTPLGAADDALAFVDLSAYEDFFADLQRGFPPPAQALGGAAPSRRAALEVHRVGAFDASFVPHPRDFERLDPRFRVPAALIERRTEYADWGFAVFKLHGASGPQRAHPMAFSFPRRDTHRLFFPTVHVHDGSIPRTATFDHQLYAQFASDAPKGWWSTPLPARQHMQMDRAQGLIDGDRPVASCTLFGSRANVDQWA